MWASTRETPWVDRAAFPYEGRILETEDASIHVLDEGEGPALLMLHGNPTWSYLYRDVIRRLRSDFRCVAIDYPGFGLSTAGPRYGYRPQDHARAVAQVIEALDLRDYTLVAHDWGGPIGLAAALSDPSRVAGLALGNTWAWPVGGDRHFERFSALMGGPIGRFGARHINLVVNAMIRAGHRRRRPARAEMRQYRAALSTADRRLASSLFAQQIIGGSEFLAGVEAGLPTLAERPALLMWADGDIAFRDVELRRWEATLSNLRVEHLSGVGHFVPSDAPAEFADAIRRWHTVQVRGR